MEGKEQVHLQSCFILGLQVLTRDALAAGLAACSTYANMFPPASALRSMPSSLPNGSASVEPTPRWPVVGTLMGGLTLTHTHSHSLTHSPTSPTSPTSPPTSPTSPTALTRSLTHSPASLHFTSLTSLTLTSLTHTHHTHITHSHSHSLTVHEHTYIHTNSPTITAPSLLYFLFPSCFSMVSLSLKKLVTCGVIRSFNWSSQLNVKSNVWYPQVCSIEGVWANRGVCA